MFLVINLDIYAIVVKLVYTKSDCEYYSTG